MGSNFQFLGGGSKRVKGSLAYIGLFIPVLSREPFNPSQGFVTSCRASASMPYSHITFRLSSIHLLMALQNLLTISSLPNKAASNNRNLYFESNSFSSNALYTAFCQNRPISPRQSTAAPALFPHRYACLLPATCDTIPAAVLLHVNWRPDLKIQTRQCCFIEPGKHGLFQFAALLAPSTMAATESFSNRCSNFTTSRSAI